MSISLKRGEYDPDAFAEFLKRIADASPQKFSSRGWAYVLEGLPETGVTKADFDRVEQRVNECRASGRLPIDFVLEEEARAFHGVEEPEQRTPEEFLAGYLRVDLDAENRYTPDWWEGEDHYIQMLVEKIDLREMFRPVCAEYHVPIATAKGWSSMLQRAEYARRFKEAEDDGLQCVLLYCGDHDPDGLRISEFLRSNLEDLQNCEWADGTGGYDPSDLIIERFGLNFEFIEANDLPWIENLLTGSGRNLASPNHKNFQLPYVQEYLRDIGERKCEANAIVQQRAAGLALCRDAIERHLGPGARARFETRRQAVRDRLDDLDDRTGYKAAIRAVLDTVEGEEP